MIPNNMEELLQAAEVLQGPFPTDPLVTSVELWVGLSCLTALEVPQTAVEKWPELIREILAMNLAGLVGDLNADIPPGNWYLIYNRCGELDVTIFGIDKPTDEWLNDFSRMHRGGLSVWPVFKK